MNKFTINVLVRVPGAVRIWDVQQVPLADFLRPVLSSDELQGFLRTRDPQLLERIRQALALSSELAGADLVRFADCLAQVDVHVGSSGNGALFSAWRDAIHATGFTGIPDILGNARRLADEYAREARRALPPEAA